ncbi:MAG TPA: helix-turn-helix domain-containing protein [Pseudobacteroides sp.]|uniref:helix-turn-helix domain-containing protein n=1 Tax=Pseudobacteroides sp. TaxID=1968840 RepID=UPI002F92C539
MSKEKLIIFSALFISFTMVISSLIIANGMSGSSEKIQYGLNGARDGLSGIGNSIYSYHQDGNLVNNSNTYDFSSTALYLGLTENELTKILNSKKSGIPHLKIGNKYIFFKRALDKWLERTEFEID